MLATPERGRRGRARSAGRCARRAAKPPARAPRTSAAARPTGAAQRRRRSARAIAALRCPRTRSLWTRLRPPALPFFGYSAGAPAHTYLALTGGAIGQGLPCATGAAVACPDRHVISFQADGSGMYTLQALWTQAREGLDVTTLICATTVATGSCRSSSRAPASRSPAPRRARSPASGNPNLDWVALAQGDGCARGCASKRPRRSRRNWSARSRSRAPK